MISVAYILTGIFVVIFLYVLREIVRIYFHYAVLKKIKSDLTLSLALKTGIEIYKNVFVADIKGKGFFSFVKGSSSKVDNAYEEVLWWSPERRYQHILSFALLTPRKSFEETVVGLKNLFDERVDGDIYPRYTFVYLNRLLFPCGLLSLLILMKISAEPFTSWHFILLALLGLSFLSIFLSIKYEEIPEIRLMPILLDKSISKEEVRARIKELKLKIW